MSVVDKHKGNDKYGFCYMSEAWLPRKEMLSCNAKFYDNDGQSYTVRLRLAPDMWESLLSQLRDIEWDNDLRDKSDLEGEVVISEGFLKPKIPRGHVRNMNSWWSVPK